MYHSDMKVKYAFVIDHLFLHFQASVLSMLLASCLHVQYNADTYRYTVSGQTSKGKKWVRFKLARERVLIMQDWITAIDLKKKKT